MKEFLGHFAHGLWVGFFSIISWFVVLQPSLPAAVAGLLGGAIFGFAPALSSSLFPALFDSVAADRGWKRALRFLTELAGCAVGALLIGLAFRGALDGWHFTGTRAVMAIIGMITGIILCEMLAKRLLNKRRSAD